MRESISMPPGWRVQRAVAAGTPLTNEPKMRSFSGSASWFRQWVRNLPGGVEGSRMVVAGMEKSDPGGAKFYR
jgi:hypothetical protein